MRKILIIAAAFLICASLLPTYARAIDLSGGNGQLVVELAYDGAPVVNFPLRITLIATARYDSNADAIVYDMVNGFTLPQGKVLGMNMDAATNRDLAASLNRQTNGAATQLTGSTDQNGEATFNNLEAGMYLLAQRNGGSADFRMAPSLVPVPYADTDGDWSNLVDAVVARTKLEPKTPPPTETTPPGTTTPPEETPSPPPESPETPTPTPPSTPSPPDTPPPPTPTPPPDRPNLVPDGDGYIEMDDTGVPRGHWDQNPDGDWIFTEYPPLADLPQTGVLRWPIPVLSASGAVLVVLGIYINRKGKKSWEE